MFFPSRNIDARKFERSHLQRPNCDQPPNASSDDQGLALCKRTLTNASLRRGDVMRHHNYAPMPSLTMRGRSRMSRQQRFRKGCVSTATCVGVIDVPFPAPCCPPCPPDGMYGSYGASLLMMNEVVGQSGRSDEGVCWDRCVR